MSALPSKDIREYFEAKLSDLKAESDLTFSVYLFFSGNSHIMLWRPLGHRPTAGFLEKYASRGLERIWIHSSDAAAFEAYRNPQAAAEAAAIAAAEAEEAAAAQEENQSTEPALENHSPEEIAAAEAAAAALMEAPPEGPRSPEAKKLIEALKSEDPKAVAAQAQSMIAEAAAAETPAQQVEVNAKMREIIKDVMDELSKEAESLVSEIWKLADIDPELEHAVNVATFAVIFAMAFGRIDPQVIADLALAGLLHDVGITQVSARLTSKPWKSFTEVELADYSRHVNASIELIETYSPTVTPRVKTLIQQHHEKFDGTGYPARLQGFKVDDVAQLVSISDVLDSVASGKWDGTIRSLRSTLEFLEGLEKSTTFPEYFNPDVFGIVATWAKTTKADTPMQGAMDTVKAQTNSLLKSA